MNNARSSWSYRWRFGTGRGNATQGVSRGQRVSRALLVLGAVAILLLSGTALAMGRVQWKSRTIKEADKSWKIEVTIFLAKPPDTSLVPVRFSFTPSAYYERALVDNREGPIKRIVPLSGRQPLVESVDVGFLDPGTGKLEPRTRFSFRVTRAHGYEAGEYDVAIKDARSDQAIGTSQRIIFDGENEVIDRRAMVFGGEKKKEDKKEKDEAAKPTAREYSPDDPAYWEGGPTEPAPKEEELPPPASMKDRPGGCGCRVVGQDADAASRPHWGIALLLGVCLLLRRTQRVKP